MEPYQLQFFSQITLTILGLIVYSILLSLTAKAVTIFGTRRNIAEKRILYTKKYFTAAYFLLLILTVTIIWGIDFRGIFIFASSFFAIVGISLFASWSILSSITSSVIIFFNLPYRIGDNIHLIDGDNSIRGVITDMTLFYIQIETADGEEVVYPNNLAIQKPIARLKKAKEMKTAGEESEQ